MQNLDSYIFTHLENTKSNHIKLKKNENIDAEIISIIMESLKDNNSSVNETTEFISIDSSYDGNGITMSVFNKPSLEKGREKNLVKLANEVSKKFKKVNISYDVRPGIGFIFIITSSFISYYNLKDDYDTLYYAEDEEDKLNTDLHQKITTEKNEKIKIEKFIESMLTDMKLALLDASLYLDEKINEW